MSCERYSFAKGMFSPSFKGVKPRCLAGEGLIRSLEGKKIPAHMTWPMFIKDKQLIVRTANSD
jgi:hypothetical protein